MKRYRLEDATGRLLEEADDVTDLFDPDDEDEEVGEAIIEIMNRAEVMIGGGAAPLLVLVDTHGSA